MSADFQFGLASAVNADEVLALYRSIIGTPGCTWSPEYPSMEEIADDIGKASLYCLRNGEGRIVAAAAAGESDELDQDGIVWSASMRRPCDLARIGVSPALHRKGLGSFILTNVIADVRKRGFDGMRMLVSKTNPAALAMYDKAGFSRCGEIFKYDIDFYCMQLVFDRR